MPPFTVDPEKDTICDVIRRWAGVQPDSPALIGVDGVTVTYGGLVEEMDEARRLVAQSGFGQSDRIGIIHRGGVDLVAVMLGVMSCSTAVPLNPSFTEPEFRDHLDERGVTGLIAAPGSGDGAVASAHLGSQQHGGRLRATRAGSAWSYRRPFGPDRLRI